MFSWNVSELPTLMSALVLLTLTARYSKRVRYIEFLSRASPIFHSDAMNINKSYV